MLLYRLTKEKGLDSMNDTKVNFKYDKALCETCRFRGWADNKTICYYIVLTGKPRGCPIDRNCIRYEMGNPPKTI